MSAELPPHRPVVDALRQLPGDRPSTSLAVRQQHGHDESCHAPALPVAAAFAPSTGEVAAIVETCARHRASAIAVGTGTSLEGRVRALHGGVYIDLVAMNVEHR